MRRPRRQPVALQVELMPLIDVVFLLLTFFIFAIVLTAPVRVMEITLPEAGASGERARGSVVVLSLAPTGEIRLDGEVVPTPVLRDRLTALQESDEPPQLVLAIDREATVGDQFELLDTVEAAGFREWNFLREPGER
ncbi:MAG: biopolymer transporter ExbD [Planctomycetota bacterium]